MTTFGLLYKLEKDESQKCINYSHVLEDLRIVDFRETNGKVHSTPHYIKYFKKPRDSLYPLNLNEGFENFIFRDNFGIKLSFIEAYLLKNNDFLERSDENSGKVKICSHRNVLMRIMRMPYHKLGLDYNSCSFVVSKFKNLTFMALNKTLSHIPNDSKYSTYPFKLKQMIFSDTFAGEPKIDVPVNENEQLFGVYRANLENLNLLYSGELDGIIPDMELTDFTDMKRLNECRFVRAKLLPKREYAWYLQPKILDIWTQAYLSKSDACIAMRDRDGFVNEPIEYTTTDFLQQKNRWKPNVCIGFLHKILNLIVETMANVDCPYTVYKYTYSAINGILVYTVHEGKTEHSFLSEKLIQRIQCI